ncbi:MAG TPA: ABC transporter substrate-binding protein [Catenuloplanes sp.]|jgi:branched-chain amino acid transport system substrate-binding protein
MALVSGCEFGGDAQDTSDIFIGADLEQSGVAAGVGKAYERALQLKVDQVNASGVLGARRLRLKLMDNHSDPASALRNIVALADDPTVTALITGSCGECVIGAAKTINDKTVPTISLAAAREVSAPVTERRFVFKLAPNALDSAAALATELERAGAKKAAILHTDDAYGRGGVEAMQAELTKAGIAAAGVASVKPTDTDLNQAVRKLTAGKPDAIVVWAPADQAGLAAGSARGAGYQGRLYYDAAAAGELFLSGPTAAAADNATMVFTQTMVIDDVIATTPAKAARKQWFRDYTSRYGSYNGSASFAADAVQLIVEAIGRVGTNRDRIREVLETSQVDGLSGPIRLTPDNHSGLMPQALAMLVVRSGRWRLAG